MEGGENMMINTIATNVNNQMAGGTQFNNPISGNVSAPNILPFSDSYNTSLFSSASASASASAVSSSIPHSSNTKYFGNNLQPEKAMEIGAQTMQVAAAESDYGSFGKDVSGEMLQKTTMIIQQEEVLFEFFLFIMLFYC